MQKPLDPLSVERTETPSASYVLRRRYGPARHIIAVASWVTVINLLLQPVTVLAGTCNWDGDTSATWATTANWSGGAAPTISDTANFQLPGPYSDSATPRNPNASGGTAVPMLGIKIGSGNGAITITTGTEFRIAAGGISIASDAAGTTTIGAVRMRDHQAWSNDCSYLLKVAGGYPASAFAAALRVTITGNGTGGTTVNGAIANGAGAVSLIVNAPNSITTFDSGVTHTYSGGTTNKAGTLLVNGTLNSQTTDVTVNSGATLGGTGTINRPVTIADGGHMTLSVEAPLKINGALTFNGSVDLTLTGTAGDGSITLIENDGAETVTFSNYTEGQTVNYDGKNYVFTYVGDDGNDVMLRPSAGGTVIMFR